MYQLERSSTNALEGAGRPPASSSASNALGRLGDELPRPGDDPARRAAAPPAARREVVVRRLEVLDVRVGDEERDRVPEREQPPLDLAGRAVAELQVLRRRRLAELPAHHVGAHPVERLVRVDRVAPRAVHLAAVLVEELLVGEHAPVRRAADERHRHEELRVEPEPDLLAHLRDPVGREPLLPVRVVGQVGAGQPLGRAGRVAARHVLGLSQPSVESGTIPASSQASPTSGIRAHLGRARLAADRHLVDPGPVELLQLLEPARPPAPRARRASRSRSGGRTSTGRRAAAGRSSASARCSSRPCCGASRPSACRTAAASTRPLGSPRAAARAPRRRR